MRPEGLPSNWGSDDLELLSELARAGQFREVLRAFDDRNKRGSSTPPPEAEYLAALAAARLGAYERASRLAESALSRLSAVADESGAMRAANLLGGVAFEQGRLDVAEARFEETLHRAHVLNDPQMAARVSNNLGSLVHLQGKGALAVNLYRSALQVYRTQGDRLGTAQTCHNLALAYRLEGRFTEALDANHQAVEAAEEAGDQALLALTRMGRAETWLESGEPAKAETELRGALELAAASGDEAGVGEAERLLALAAMRRQRYDLAMRHAHRGRKIAGRLRCPELRGQCDVISALAARAVGQPRLANRFRLRAVQAFRSLGASGLLRRFELDWAS
ncbi:MAG TPA: tetratricopeptide repeat protein [Gemmatimonadales bacterium]|nr:tetratricopeptide repeat protein [Gemmatimonadales bacterium]